VGFRRSNKNYCHKRVLFAPECRNGESFTLRGRKESSISNQILLIINAVARQDNFRKGAFAVYGGVLNKNVTFHLHTHHFLE